MKTLFRVLALGMLLTMLGVISGFAQDASELETLFNQYKTQKKAPCGQRDAALATAKTIIEKFGNDELNKEVVDYVKKDSEKIAKDDPICKRNAVYNDSYKAKDWPKFMSTSKDIINQEGDSELGFDVLLTAVSVGYNRSATEKNNTYNNDTLNYAKTALQKLNSGKTSKQYGVFEPFKSKENATSWMNYIIGYYTNLDATSSPEKKREALSYFFKATQVGTENKSDVKIYTDIGDYYFNQAATLDEEYRKIRAANNNEENDEAKAKLALARGYADRSIDAFGRARQVATQASKKQVADAITKRLGDLYRFRFNLAPTAPTPEMEKYVSDLLAKPMPDPSTDVTPVVEQTPTTATTPSTSTTTTPAANTSATTKAAATTTTKPAATTTPAAESTDKTTTPAAKKPVVTKKKGTR